MWFHNSCPRTKEKGLSSGLGWPELPGAHICHLLIRHEDVPFVGAFPGFNPPKGCLHFRSEKSKVRIDWVSNEIVSSLSCPTFSLQHGSVSSPKEAQDADAGPGTGIALRVY